MDIGNNWFWFTLAPRLPIMFAGFLDHHGPKTRASLEPKTYLTFVQSSGNALLVAVADGLHCASQLTKMYVFPALAQAG